MQTNKLSTRFIERLILMATLVVTTVSIQGFAACTPSPSGIVSWWRAEGNGADSAGNNAGTLVGGTTFDSGEAGQAFVFNGSGQAVSVANDPSLQLQKIG